MDRKWHIVITFALTVAFLLFIIFNRAATPVITYFPHDPDLVYLIAETNISVRDQEDKDTYLVEWSSRSSLDKPVYLRQDVSLLFIDGKWKGTNSVWREKEKNIELSSNVQMNMGSLIQAITFHHGEVHYPSDEIYSVLQMSASNLFVMDSSQQKLETFSRPMTKRQKEWGKTVIQSIDKYLQSTWKDWIDDKGINLEEYHMIPLVDLIQFQETNIDSLTKEQTDKIIGQLWEGLYKNYIIPMLHEQWKTSSAMPVILFSKDHTHLLVLFEDGNKEIQLLRQQYSL